MRRRPRTEEDRLDYIPAGMAVRRTLGLLGNTMAVVTVTVAATCFVISDYGKPVRTMVSNGWNGLCEGISGDGERESDLEVTPVHLPRYGDRVEGVVSGVPSPEKPSINLVETTLVRTMDGYKSPEGRHMRAPRITVDKAKQCLIVDSETDMVLLEIAGENGQVLALSNIKGGVCEIPFSDLPEDLAAKIAYGQSVRRPENGEALDAKHYSLIEKPRFK